MKRDICERALELGFDAVGIARADDVIDDDFSRYEAFIEDGLYGQMHYLAAHRLLRRSLDSPNLLDGARSVICVAQRYFGGEDSDVGVASQIARYARGRDYHLHLRQALNKLADFIRQIPGAEARSFCDTAPVLERAWAVRSGLGFIGKNCMLIIPGLGSYVLLGEVVTTLKLEADAPQRQRCGECSRCLAHCPTRALLSPHRIDPRLCIGYATIEHQGQYDCALEALVGTRLFGCDACQEVCPFNATSRASPFIRTQYAALPRWQESTMTELLALDDQAVEVLLQGTSLRRARSDGLRRNLLVAAGNSGLPEMIPLVERFVTDSSCGWVRQVASRALLRLRQAQFP